MKSGIQVSLETVEEVKMHKNLAEDKHLTIRFTEAPLRIVNGVGWAGGEEGHMEWIYVYIWLIPLHCTAETNNIARQLHPNLKKM